MPEIIAIGAQRLRAAALAPALDQSLGIERPWRDGAVTGRDDRAAFGRWQPGRIDDEIAHTWSCRSTGKLPMVPWIAAST
jgi:hypothetical protein